MSELNKEEKIKIMAQHYLHWTWEALAKGLKKADMEEKRETQRERGVIRKNE